MISVNPNEIPKWSITSDAKKIQYISDAVKKYLVPKYSDNEEWCKFFDYLSSFDAFVSSSHYYRYLNTFGNISAHLGTIVDKTIVETGGVSPITLYLSNKNDCFSTESDLRMEFDIDSEFADIIVSMEVIEHIKDRPEKSFSEITLFQESGIKSFASEVSRVVKPGGDVILTTPNTSSYKAIENAIEHKAPYVFRPHPREYTKDELLNFFHQLDIENHLTMYNFFMLGGATIRWDKIFKENGWSLENRGDDHFFYFTKK